MSLEAREMWGTPPPLFVVEGSGFSRLPDEEERERHRRNTLFLRESVRIATLKMNLAQAGIKYKPQPNYLKNGR